MGEQLAMSFEDTSLAAFNSIDATALERLVLKTIALFGSKGCISDQVRAALPHLSYSSVTARYKALVDAGQVEVIGKRKGLSGRPQRVYRATQITGETA
jgi:endonuclease V-like protein UPF0215 family